MAESKRASVADVLILGDSAALNLKRFTDDFIKKTSSQLKKPLSVYNWSQAGETMAQTYAKVRSLRKLPTLTIYHGGTEEFWTRRFYPPESATILANIKKSENDTLLSLLLTFPLLSRFAYTPIKEVSINSIPTPHRDDYTPGQVQKILSLHYTIYRQELSHLFTYFKEKDAMIWVIPQALNLLKVPARTCQTSDDQQTLNLRNTIEELAKENKYKEARDLAVTLAQTTLTNASDYYQLGQLLVKNGAFETARRAFYRARMYDCGLRYSTPIHLKILMEEGEKKSFPIIDFNREVNNQLGRNKLFFDETTPHDLYYYKLIETMVTQFNKFLKG